MAPSEPTPVSTCDPHDDLRRRFASTEGDLRRVLDQLASTEGELLRLRASVQVHARRGY